MAIYKCKYRIGFTDIDKNNLIKNRAIIKILENAGGMHSDSIKCGYTDIEETGKGWVILAWKIKVLSIPKYNTEVETHTWVRDINKIFTYRDYKMYDEDGNLAAIATSKWAMIDVKRGKIAEITSKIEEDYQPEDISVFEERKIDKLAEPETVILKRDCPVLRGDIDMNGHVHNVNYLNYAYETLPAEVYLITQNKSKNKSRLQVTIFEGRNREVRRMMEHFNYEVTRLERIAYGNLTCGSLRQGEYRRLRSFEVRELLKMIDQMNASSR